MFVFAAEDTVNETLLVTFPTSLLASVSPAKESVNSLLVAEGEDKVGAAKLLVVLVTSVGDDIMDGFSVTDAVIL